MLFLFHGYVMGFLCTSGGDYSRTAWGQSGQKQMYAMDLDPPVLNVVNMERVIEYIFLGTINLFKKKEFFFFLRCLVGNRDSATSHWIN